jgi:hypothetical protein
MKIDYSLSPEELKAAVGQYLVSLGHPVATTDSFVLNPDGTVTVEIAQESPAAILSPKEVDSTIQPVKTPTVPTSGLQQGHWVTLDPPYSVTGSGTMFGLDWDGGIDAGDNGEGFFHDPATGKSYNTRVKTLEGVSLPREVMLSSFLHVDLWDTDGITPIWPKYASMLRQWVDGNKPLLTIDSGGNSVTSQPLVDAGPTAETDNAIDLTYATAHALNTHGKAACTYMIQVAGKPVEIRGWNSKLGKVGLGSS